MNEFDLSKLDLFEGCSKKELKKASRLVTGVVVPAGRELMAQGAVGKECMIICTGTVAIIHDGEQVRQAGPGDLIGEVALMGDAHIRTASAVAETECSVLALTPREFEELIETIPVVASRVDHATVERLVAMMARSEKK